MLKIYLNMAEHPIKKLMESGVFVTINSDDPGMFLSDLIDNYLQVANQFNLKANDIEKLAINSFEASFLDEKEKARYIKELSDKAKELRTKLSIE
ncbi:MAG: hypothetical protein QW589_03990 [Candidatus Bathyarchaeia archaeon]